MRLATLVAVGLAACIALPASAQSPADWDNIVAAAKKEGSVTFYTGLPGNPSTKKIGAAFEKKYGIRMDVLELRATELRERVRAERVGNNATGDVMHTSANQTRQIWMEDKTIDTIGPLPNGKDLRADVGESWVDRDVNIPTFLLNYGILINSNLVPDAPKSWSDLLDPKWKGKILADDFRAIGGGSSFFSVTYEKFGRGFHEKLAAQNVVFTRDMREAERRVARGEYAIYLPWLVNYLPSLKGLPVKAAFPQEGVVYLPYASSILTKAPHPNAARLFIDFMLSDEGQAIYASEGLLPSKANQADKLPPDYAYLAGIKLLGVSKLELTDPMVAAAKELYK
ncbi:MAG: ABC transporter substrate-binding protein [Rhizomicrobium sp.]